MKDPVVHEALRQIQDIVAQETGNPLAGTAKSRVQRVLSSALGQLAGVRGEDRHLTRDVTILLADLRGFTTISANYPAVIVLELLNRCFVRMSEIIFQHHGGIDKFMGDSILVIFESEARGNAAVQRALHCAVDMQLAMEELNVQHRDEGWPEMYFGIGINTGRVMAALLGSDLYSEHTVIGDEVNLASRIEAFSLRGQVLVSQSTYELCQDFADCGPPVQVYMKGKAESVLIREVKGIPSLGKFVPRRELRRSARVDVLLPFAYQIVSRKTVLATVDTGTIHNIGYDGVLVEIERPLPLYAEIKLAVNLVSLGYRAEDVYGRIVDVREDKGRWFCGVEFTSVTRQASEKIRLFVQMLIPSYVPVQATRDPKSTQEAAVGDIDHRAVQDRRRIES